MGALSSQPNPSAGSVRALLRLSESRGWGPTTVREGLERTGSASALLREAARGRPLAPWSRVDAILAACSEADVVATGVDGARYPECLRSLADPPPVLFSRGDHSTLDDRRRVVIVGSRRATAYGRRAAEALAGAAARAGWVVVSGLALGIDGAAHRGALEAGGSSVAVLGSGPDRPTPRAHRGLSEELRRQGCLLSEFPPGVEARPHHFPRRNRILAALADTVVVVEAGRRSGALITARLALELGRDVWAVPSPIFSPVCEGTHRLLEDGARPVVTLDAWAAALRDGDPLDRPRVRSPEAAPGGDAGVRAVWTALAAGPRTLEGLLTEVGLGPTEALAALTRLEVDGWVWRSPGGAFERRAA